MNMTNIFLHLYALRGKRRGQRYAMVNRHYLRVARMYGGAERFSVGK
jgi:hypothetical protein